MFKEKLEYILIRTLTYPLRFLPYKAIHLLGRSLGFIAYFFLTEYRKRALSNLALAKDLKLTDKELKKVAIKSFQNLAITCLEYPKLAYEKDISKVVTCVNPETSNELHKKGIGIIFFCGHQSNWETLLLEGCTRMKGIAIAKPTHNKLLYNWIVSIREKTGGKIILQKNALKESMRALKKGQFVGILGDQGMPESSYHFPFLGRNAYSSTASALLSYKMKSPIIVATIKRGKDRYFIHYSDPIWPNLESPMDQEVHRLTFDSLVLFEKSIIRSPGEWLWQHNKYKQQSSKILNKPFRKDCILIVLPKKCDHLLEHLATLRKIYPTEFLFLLAPRKSKKNLPTWPEKVFFYTSQKDLFLKDYRFKLVLNLANYEPLKKHYLKLSASSVPTLHDLKKLAPPTSKNLSQILTSTLCKPGRLT